MNLTGIVYLVVAFLVACGVVSLFGEGAFSAYTAGIIIFVFTIVFFRTRN